MFEQSKNSGGLRSAIPFWQLVHLPRRRLDPSIKPYHVNLLPWYVRTHPHICVQAAHRLSTLNLSYLGVSVKYDRCCQYSTGGRGNSLLHSKVFTSSLRLGPCATVRSCLHVERIVVVPRLKTYTHMHLGDIFLLPLDAAWSAWIARNRRSHHLVPNKP